MDLETVMKRDFPQDSENNEYRYLSAPWLDEIAVGLTAGAVKHPGETWKTIPADEHLARAMRHINLYRKGDRSEPHIINASMRLMMAFETAEENLQVKPTTGESKHLVILKFSNGDELHRFVEESKGMVSAIYRKRDGRMIREYFCKLGYEDKMLQKYYCDLKVEQNNKRGE